MYTRENDGILVPQRIMPHLFSQNAARESNFTSCRYCSHTSKGNTGQISGDHALSLVTTMAASPNSSFKVSTQVSINGHQANALLDSGSTDKSFISDDFAKTLGLHRHSATGYVCIATSSLKFKNSGILLS